MLRARIADYVEAQTEAAESGIPATVPDEVRVSFLPKAIDGDWGAGESAFFGFLSSKEATPVPGVYGTRLVPFTLFPRIVEHPQFSRAWLAIGADRDWDEDYPYPKLDRTLNNVVSAWNAGATQEQAAAHALYHHEGKVVVGVESKRPDRLRDTLNRFFADNGIYSPEYLDSALVPPSLIVPLSEIPSVTGLLSVDISEWDANRDLQIQQSFRERTIWRLLPPDQRSPNEPAIPGRR